MPYTFTERVTMRIGNTTITRAGSYDCRETSIQCLMRELYKAHGSSTYRDGLIIHRHELSGDSVLSLEYIDKDAYSDVVMRELRMRYPSLNINVVQSVSPFSRDGGVYNLVISGGPAFYRAHWWAILFYRAFYYYTRQCVVPHAMSQLWDIPERWSSVWDYGKDEFAYLWNHKEDEPATWRILYSDMGPVNANARRAELNRVKRDVLRRSAE